MLTFLSLTTKMAQTVTATEMLVDAYKLTVVFTPLVMGLGDVWGKTHGHRKVRTRTDYVVALHLVVFGLPVYIFPVGGTTAMMIE
jgi:hypothetical protein